MVGCQILVSAYDILDQQPGRGCEKRLSILKFLATNVLMNMTIAEPVPTELVSNGTGRLAKEEIDAASELIPVEMVDMFLAQYGWERFSQDINGEPYQVFAVGVDSTVDTGRIDFHHARQLNRRSARLAKDGRAIFVMVKGKEEEIYDDDLAVIDDISRGLKTLTKKKPKKKPGQKPVEEPAERIHPLFTNKQLEAVEQAWRKVEKAAEVLGISDKAVKGRLLSAQHKAGVNNTHELFFYAVEEDIINPWAVEVDAVWDPEIDGIDLEMAKNLHLPDGQLRQQFGGRFRSRLGRLMKRTGASTRRELWILTVQEGVAEFPTPRA